MNYGKLSPAQTISLKAKERIICDPTAGNMSILAMVRPLAAHQSFNGITMATTTKFGLSIKFDFNIFRENYLFF
jgi:hypothetical protein